MWRFWRSNHDRSENDDDEGFYRLDFWYFEIESVWKDFESVSDDSIRVLDPWRPASSLLEGNHHRTNCESLLTRLVAHDDVAETSPKEIFVEVWPRPVVSWLSLDWHARFPWSPRRFADLHNHVKWIDLLFRLMDGHTCFNQRHFAVLFLRSCFRCRLLMFFTSCFVHCRRWLTIPTGFFRINTEIEQSRRSRVHLPCTVSMFRRSAVHWSKSLLVR